MRRKGKYIKTLLVFILINIIILGFHTNNYIKIKTLNYSEDWNRGLEIDTSNWYDEVILSYFDDNILNVVVDDTGKLKYSLFDIQGKLIKQGNTKINYDRNNSKEIYLLGNSLFYLYDNNMYMSSYQIDKGFKEPKIILKNIASFTAEEVNGEKIIEAFNDEQVLFFKLHNNNISLIEKIDNRWNLTKAYLRKNGERDLIFLLTEEENYEDNLLMGEIVDGNVKSIKKIAEAGGLTKKQICNLNINELDSNTVIFYIERIFSQGKADHYIRYKFINNDTFNIVTENRISKRDSQYGISSIGQDGFSYIEKNNVHIIARGQNIKNKYSSYNDVFDISLDSQGNYLNTEFISTTYYNTRLGSMIDTGYGQYMIIKDIKNHQYSLLLASNYENFITNNKISKEDYKYSILQSLSSPFYAIASMIMLNGQIAILYVFVLYLIAGLVLKKLKIDNKKIQFWVFLGVYLLISLFTFKDNYYTQQALKYMPELLKANWIAYGICILINLVSGLMLYVFYKDNNKKSIYLYLALFIIVDVYLDNLLYVPFVFVKTLLSFG